MKLEIGEILSETSFYRFERVKNKMVLFKHLQSGDTVGIYENYVEKYLVSSSQFKETIVVGKQDKYYTEKQLTDNPVEGVRVGDVRLKGIHTIWNEIGLSSVFTVVYKKTDTPLSNKKYKLALEEQITKAIQEIETAQVQRKGVLNVAKEVLKRVQSEPVLPYTEGEIRTLVGAKKNTYSVNGLYEVFDLTLEAPDNERRVNINTIKELIVNGVKYIVE